MMPIAIEVIDEGDDVQLYRKPEAILHVDVSTPTQPLKGVPIPDDPPVAAIDDGGPIQPVTRYTQPVDFAYEVVQGFFIQNGPEPKHLAFEQLRESAFGLIDTSPKRWQNLKSSIEKLNADAATGVQYKVLFLGRHGQGWHNQGGKKYGIADWEAKWTYLNGDGVLTWGPDPGLTELGFEQARAINAVWRREAEFGAPITSAEMRWFASPFTRVAQTLLGSWDGLLGKRPEVWEDLREIYGSHTCDKRSSKSVFASRFPQFDIEDGFAEEDELWTPDHRESDASMQTRARRALDRMFKGAAAETYISITAHSAIFRNLLAVLEHQPYPLATGEMIPVVVKATRA